MKTIMLSLMSGLFMFSAQAAESEEMNTNVLSACQNDVKQYCSDITAGEGRILACLKSHDDKLSSNCKQEWQKERKQWKEMMFRAHTACADEIQKYCREAEGVREIIKCLGSHNTDLSNTCKSFWHDHSSPQTPETRTPGVPATPGTPNNS